jgi:hypothetical protein
MTAVTVTSAFSAMVRRGWSRREGMTVGALRQTIWSDARMIEAALAIGWILTSHVGAIVGCGQVTLATRRVGAGVEGLSFQISLAKWMQR